jgi:hypothetical protein
MWDNIEMLFIVKIKFINCLAGLIAQIVDCAVRWNSVNRHFNLIDLAGGRHRLECIFNQSAFRIRPTHCINLDNAIDDFTPADLRVETIDQSFRHCHDAPVLPASEWLKRREQGMAGVPDEA